MLLIFCQIQSCFFWLDQVYVKTRSKYGAGLGKEFYSMLYVLVLKRSLWSLQGMWEDVQKDWNAGMAIFNCDHLHYKEPLPEKNCYSYLFSDLINKSSTCDLRIKFSYSTCASMVTANCSTDSQLQLKLWKDWLSTWLELKETCLTHF